MRRLKVALPIALVAAGLVALGARPVSSQDVGTIQAVIQQDFGAPVQAAPVSSYVLIYNGTKHTWIAASVATAGATVVTSAPLSGDGSAGTPVTMPTTATPQVAKLGLSVAAPTNTRLATGSVYVSDNGSGALFFSQTDVVNTPTAYLEAATFEANGSFSTLNGYSGYFAFNNPTNDMILSEASAGVLQVQNYPGNGSTHVRIYNAADSYANLVANADWLDLGSASNIYQIAPKKIGTGTVRPLQIVLPNSASDPTNVALSGILYTKVASGHSAPFFEDEAGTVTQLSGGGSTVTTLAPLTGAMADTGGDSTSVAVGVGASTQNSGVSNQYSVAIGNIAEESGPSIGVVAIGYDTQVAQAGIANYSIGLGYNVKVNQSNSIGVGAGVIINEPNEYVSGSTASVISSVYAGGDGVGGITSYSLMGVGKTVAFTVSPDGSFRVAGVELNIASVTSNSVSPSASASFSNAGATTTSTVNLPRAAVGTEIRVYVRASQSVTVQAPSGHTIYLGTTASPISGNWAASVPGVLVLRLVDPVTWESDTFTGTWTHN